MSRRGCVLGCGAWLLLMALPLLALWLAVQREVVWTRGPAGLEQDRVFYLDEPQAGGLGYLAARVVRDAAGQVCVQTRVTYWLWRSAEAGDPAAAYCQCYTRAAGGLELSADPCPGE
ncbi:MAG: hypothetical protein KA764_16320 [Anaerolineales bacterium]|nr:hypothetical protein [Anaerolineales bacterium]